MDQSTNVIFIPYSFIVTPTTAIGALAQQNVPVLISEDYDVEIHEIFGTSTSDGVTDIRPNNFTALITDKGNGRNWSDAPIPQTVFARVPTGMTLQRPIVLARKSNLNVLFTNLVNGNMTPTLVFVGAKIVS